MTDRDEMLHCPHCDWGISVDDRSGYSEIVCTNQACAAVWNCDGVRVSPPRNLPREPS